MYMCVHVFIVQFVSKVRHTILAYAVLSHVIILVLEYCVITMMVFCKHCIFEYHYRLFSLWSSTWQRMCRYHHCSQFYHP